ncbi:MAG: helix-turn-helix domain-containing protein [Candidatus Hydrothermia bacterium]
MVLKEIMLDDKEFYTIEEIAKLLRVSKKTIYRYIKNLKLKAIKTGKYLIKKSDLVEFIQESYYVEIKKYGSFKNKNKNYLIYDD